MKQRKIFTWEHRTSLHMCMITTLCSLNGQERSFLMCQERSQPQEGHLMLQIHHRNHKIHKIGCPRNLHHSHTVHVKVKIYIHVLSHLEFSYEIMLALLVLTVLVLTA